MVPLLAEHHRCLEKCTEDLGITLEGEYKITLAGTLHQAIGFHETKIEGSTTTLSLSTTQGGAEDESSSLALCLDALEEAIHLIRESLEKE
jgi:hypothetical protein